MTISSDGAPLCRAPAHHSLEQRSSASAKEGAALPEVIIAQLAALALGAGALRLSLRPDAPIHPAAAVFATVRAFRQQETRVRGTGSRAPRSATLEKSLLFLQA